MNWHDQCYRKLFIDFHNHETVSGIAEDFDADRWAGQLSKIGVEAVNVFTNDMFGWKYYRKGQYGAVHPNLPEKLDIVEDTVRACHARGIRVVAYYAPQRPAPIRDSHPEWLVKDSDGTPSQTHNGLCKIGPAGADLLAQIEEITRLYDVDGFFIDGSYAFRPCYCAFCRTAFRVDNGMEIPTNNADEHWAAYLAWLLDRHRQFRLDVYAAAHRGNPDVVVLDNWAYTYKLSDPIPGELGALFCDVPADNQLFNVSMTARSFAMSGKSFDVQNTGFLKWWGEWGLKPVSTMQRECASLIANGGRVFLGYQMQPRFFVEPAVLYAFDQVFDFVREREELCRGSTIIPEIGVYHSARHRGITHTGDVWPETVGFSGVHKLLTDMGLHYNLLSDDRMEDTISRFKVVILPDMRYIPPKTAELVRRYVKAGGKLIVAGPCGTLGEDYKTTGGCALADVLGIEWLGNWGNTHAYIDQPAACISEGVTPMPLMVEAPFVRVNTAGADSLAKLRGLTTRSDGNPTLRYSPPGEPSGHPAVTVNQYGQGTAVFFAGDIFRGYYTGCQWNLRPMLSNVLRNVLGYKPMVKLVGTWPVEIVPTKKDGALLIHLINQAGGQPATGQAEIFHMIADVVPLRSLTLQVRMDREPSSVTGQPGKVPLDWGWDGKCLSIGIPQLDIHACVVIQF